MKQIINFLALAFVLMTGVGAGSNLYASSNYHRSEIINTDAGPIDFSFFENIKIPAYQQVRSVDQDRKIIELEDGSVLSVAKIELAKEWEGQKKLVLTQNHATFSTFKYALVNLDLKLATPVSLLREPTPSSGVLFVKDVDTTHDKLTLNNNKTWLIHRSDRGVLSKINENDRIIIGVNTGEDRSSNPYLLIDTSKNTPFRSQLLD